MRLEATKKTANAQRVTREVIHDVAATLRAGDSEISAARKINERLERTGVKRWLHTAYAWWGDRTRFAGFVDWEPDALPTDRTLAEGDCFILDAAPLVDGYPSDYAFSGVLGDGAPLARDYDEMKRALVEVKDLIVELARSGIDAAPLFSAVTDALRARKVDVIHPMYPAGVLGHSFDAVNPVFGRVPRIGQGFQLPLMGTYAVALAKHHLAGGPYPFLNENAPGRPVGLFAIEPHVARGNVACKFESILLIDGSETRWLDPGLFGEIEG